MHPNGKSQREFLCGVSLYAHSHREWILHIDNQPEKLSLNTIRQYAASGVKGAIICETYVENLAEILTRSPIPIVIFGSPSKEIRSTESLVGWSMSDDEGIGRYVAEYFISLGQFRSYSFIPDPQNSGWSRGHQKGFLEAMTAAGKKVDVFDALKGDTIHKTPADLDPAVYDDLLSRWLRSIPKPAAVMAASDQLGVRTVSLARSIGIKIPSQQSIIGVGNDISLDELSIPSLSSVAVDHEEEGRNAAKLLARFLNGREKRNLCVIRSRTMKIIERESSKPITPAAILINKALAYIASNADRNIKIIDVAEHLNISRRLLDLRFNQFHNKTIGESILEARLTEVRRQLSTTYLPLQAIAANCEFPNLHYLKKIYKRFFGQPPENHYTSKKKAQ